LAKLAAGPRKGPWSRGFSTRSSSSINGRCARFWAQIAGICRVARTTRAKRWPSTARSAVPISPRAAFAVAILGADSGSIPCRLVHLRRRIS